MRRLVHRLGALLLGRTDRQRLRVSQTLLGMPALFLMQAMLLQQWQHGLVDGPALAVFLAVSLSGIVLLYGAVRLGWGERISHEGSLSTPQMVFAMVCVAWGYALAGPGAAALLCLMPLILCFGIFALEPRAATALALFGILLLGGVMGALAWWHPAAHPPWMELWHWVFASASMAMIRALAERLGRMRARLSEQKAELSDALERIRLLATRDALTGLLNRRAALDELRRALDHASQRRQPLVVALADLDHFKQVNDSFGHQVGDRVLQAFAAAAEQQLRGSDRVARWGGEEFLFVMPDTRQDQAGIFLDRLRGGFAQARVEGLPEDHPLSFSAGVALCHDVADIETAIERADRAMYSAKLAGRGRTHRPPAPAVQREAEPALPLA